MESHNAVDHTGDRFGRLVILGRSHKGKERRWWWHCRCDCRNEIIVCGRELRNGNTKSCKCSTGEIISESNNRHGEAHRGKVSGIYRSWADAKSRCSNPNMMAYSRYGGRGIEVCIRWQFFDAFLEDMGSTWEPGMTLDRIDPDGNYEPENCQWLTKSENSKKGSKRGD